MTRAERAAVKALRTRVALAHRVGFKVQVSLEDIVDEDGDPLPPLEAVDVAHAMLDRHHVPRSLH